MAHKKIVVLLLSLGCSVEAVSPGIAAAESRASNSARESVASLDFHIPFSRMMVVTESGTWNPPVGVTKIYFQMWGGGGGGAGGTDSSFASGGGSGGGGGAYASGLIFLQDAEPIEIVIGKGGDRGNLNSAGSDGEESTLGNYLIVPGGKGGKPLSIDHVAGGSLPRAFGHVNRTKGGLGMAPQRAVGGFGGASFGGSFVSGSADPSRLGTAGRAPGGGGGGGYGQSTKASGGGDGAPGRAVIWY